MTSLAVKDKDSPTFPSPVLDCNAKKGLDAATALEFIRALRTSADVLDTVAVIAIYQCSREAYDLFDKLSVLYDGY
jgi:ATP-binding cassette subfamily G (WHITE) protein 2 (PDR)